jgi:hypothetical protein
MFVSLHVAHNGSLRDLCDFLHLAHNGSLRDLCDFPPVKILSHC